MVPAQPVGLRRMASLRHWRSCTCCHSSTSSHARLPAGTAKKTDRQHDTSASRTCVNHLAPDPGAANDKAGPRDSIAPCTSRVHWNGVAHPIMPFPTNLVPVSAVFPWFTSPGTQATTSVGTQTDATCGLHAFNHAMLPIRIAQHLPPIFLLVNNLKIRLWPATSETRLNTS